MATFNKFQSFVEDIAEKQIDLSADTLRILLTNTAPQAADVRVDTDEAVCQIQATSNANEIAAGSGYTKKGTSVTITASAQTAGTYKLTGNDVVYTASGAVGPFRYAVLYSDTGKTSETRPVIGWWDYGSGVTLANGETFTVDLDQVNGILTIA